MDNYIIYNNLIDNNLEKIVSLDQEQFPLPWSLSQWEESLKNNSFKLIFHKEHTSFCLFHIIEDQAHLLKILVDKNIRGTGEALRLFNFSCEFLKLKKQRSIFLEVDSENISALKFYEKIGFDTVHISKNFYGKDKNAQKMIYTID